MRILDKIKRKKEFKKRLARMMWEYENELKPRIDIIEKVLKDKGILKIYTSKDFDHEI